MENKIDFDKEFKKVFEILEDNDFSFDDVVEQDGEYYLDISLGTPCGEDWIETIWFNGTLNSFIESLEARIENFDIDEEIEPWISQRGKNGVPSSISALIEDANWKLETLEDLLAALKGEKKTKYRVTVKYEGSWDFEIAAYDEDEAMEMAQEEFEKLPSSSLTDTMEHYYIDSCEEL